MSKSLTSRQESLLLEAKRRYVVFYPAGKDLIEAWTGLGYRTTYKPVLSAGLMEWVRFEPRPRCMGWLRLTEAGAAIVQEWLAEEVTDDNHN